MSRGTVKPLGCKCYGSIPHLPGSRVGPGDYSLTPGQAKILTLKPRDAKDRIIVTEKVDGSNVGVARVDGVLIPLIRAGYPALSSQYEQHQLFAAWVFERLDRFEWLANGQRICGEWLAQVHGTHYQLHHDPFVVFDIFTGDQRWPYDAMRLAVKDHGLVATHLLSDGPPVSIARALALLGDHGHHGAIDLAEGAVWRVERDGQVDFLGKYVRPGKVDGAYLSSVSGKPDVWIWRPGDGLAPRPSRD